MSYSIIIVVPHALDRHSIQHKICTCSVNQQFPSLPARLCALCLRAGLRIKPGWSPGHRGFLVTVHGHTWIIHGPFVVGVSLGEPVCGVPDFAQSSASTEDFIIRSRAKAVGWGERRHQTAGLFLSRRDPVIDVVILIASARSSVAAVSHIVISSTYEMDENRQLRFDDCSYHQLSVSWGVGTNPTHILKFTFEGFSASSVPSLTCLSTCLSIPFYTHIVGIFRGQKGACPLIVHRQTHRQESE